MYNYHYDDSDPRFDYEELPKHVSDDTPKCLIRTKDVYQSEPDESLEGYSQRALDVFATFNNSGVPEGCNGSAVVGISKHGERSIEVYLRVNPETLVVEAAGFRAHGDISTIVCASRAAAMVEGETFAAALQLDAQRLRDDLGTMPPDRVTRTYIAACAVHAALADFYLRQGKSPDEARTLAPCDEEGMGCIMCERCSYREKRIDLQYS